MTATTEADSAVETAKRYYDSADADSFYSTVWGGEDIHIGIYETDSEDIVTASRRTVECVAARLPKLAPPQQIVDLGAGYGGAARYLAQRFGCRVTAINLSSVENDRHRRINREQRLVDLIDVVDGSFEAVPLTTSTVDVVWSQDAILHSANRDLVIREVGRILKPGGHFVFTDPMQADECDPSMLRPVLDRIHLPSLGSPAFYCGAAEVAGLRLASFEERTADLICHYQRVLEETEKRTTELSKQISPGYLERMKVGLGHWIRAGEAGNLVWGIFHFTKSADVK